MYVTLDNGTDGQTDRQTDRRTDRRTDRVQRNMRPPPREEGRIKISKVRTVVWSIKALSYTASGC